MQSAPSYRRLVLVLKCRLTLAAGGFGRVGGCESNVLLMLLVEAGRAAAGVTGEAAGRSGRSSSDLRD